MSYLTRLYFSCWHELIFWWICSNNHPNLQIQLQSKVALFLESVLKISSNMQWGRYFNYSKISKAKLLGYNLFQLPFLYTPLCCRYMCMISVAKINNYFPRWGKRGFSSLNTFMCLIWARKKGNENNLEGKNVWLLIHTCEFQVNKCWQY